MNGRKIGLVLLKLACLIAFGLNSSVFSAGSDTSAPVLELPPPFMMRIEATDLALNEKITALKAESALLKQQMDQDFLNFLHFQASEKVVGIDEKINQKKYTHTRTADVQHEIAIVMDPANQRLDYRPHLTGAFPEPPVPFKQSLMDLVQIDFLIKAAANNAGSAKADVYTAISDYLPNAEAAGEYGRQNVSYSLPIFNTNLNYNLTDYHIKQLITDFGKTTALIGIAKENFFNALNTLKQTEQTEIERGITAYVDVIRDTKNLELTIANRDRVAQQLAIEEKRLKIGAGRKASVLQVQAQLSGAEARVVKAKRDLIISRNIYQSIFQKLPGNFSQSAMPPMPTHSIPKTLNKALEIAYTQNTRLIGLLHQAQIAKDKINSAMSTFAPALTLNGDEQHQDNYNGLPGIKIEKTVSVDFTYQLFRSGGDVARVRSARDQYYAAQDNYQNELLSVREEVSDDWERFQAAKVGYLYLLRQSVQLDEFLNLAEKELELGQRSLVDVLVADTNSITAETAAVTAKAEMVIASYDLLESMGVLSVDQVQ